MYACITTLSHCCTLVSPLHMKLPHMVCCSLTVAKVFFSQSSYSVSESNGSLLVVLKTSKLHSEAFNVIIAATEGSAKRKQSV